MKLVAVIVAMLCGVALLIEMDTGTLRRRRSPVSIIAAALAVVAP